MDSSPCQELDHVLVSVDAFHDLVMCAYYMPRREIVKRKPDGAQRMTGGTQSEKLSICAQSEP